MGDKTDMNRANDVRPMFRRLADVAERTGCAVILIGHLNKAAGGQSAYRGLGIHICPTTNITNKRIISVHKSSISNRVFTTLVSKLSLIHI